MTSSPAPTSPEAHPVETSGRAARLAHRWLPGPFKMRLSALRHLMVRPPAVDAQYRLWSFVCSLHDQGPAATDELIDLALALTQRARTMDLSGIAPRLPDEERYLVSNWPGEHYRLLAAISDVLRPALVVEVGT